ncbi:MAG TPA: DUF6599 family protein [bacterium]
MRRPAALVLACALAALPPGAATAAADPAGVLPDEAALAPLRRAGAIERHTPETLWERIDGEAELYRGYGLAASAHVLYADPAAGERRVEASVFSFADPLGAFGVFAAFRPPAGAGGTALGNGGCVEDYQGFFWQGAHFVLADAAGPDATRASDVRRALEAAAARLGAPPPPPKALADFSRVADARTVRYQPQHLLGREALPPGLEGVAAGTPVFVSVPPASLEDAKAWLAGYARALEGAALGERDGRPLLVGRDPALGPVVLLGGAGGIAGARSSPDAEGILELLATLLGTAGGQGAGDTR